MKDFHRDDLKYKEIPSKLSPSMGLCILSLVFRPTYPEILCPNFFFGKSMAQKYPTYLKFGHMSKLLYFFLLQASLS